MGREWKPGDVVMIDADYSRFDGQLGVVVEEEGGTWAVIVPTHDPEPMAFGAKTLRPLVVIDPENPEDVERLADAWDDAHYSGPLPDAGMPLRDLRMQAALREFATPTPPRPEEPTGLGAVVEDAEGERWVRVTVENKTWPGECWQDRYGDKVRWTKYVDIDAVRVLSEGWSE